MADEADLLIEAGFSDAKLARESAKVIDMFKQTGTKAEKAFQSAVDSVSGSQKVKATARELDKLKREFDPLYAASKRYEAQVGKLNRAHEVGAISAKQHAAALSRLNDDFAAGAAKAEQGARRFGGGVQQAGFQIADFASQVSNGTSAFVAFGQQGSQLLGMLGPWGAAAGAAVAVGAPLVALWVKGADDAGTLEDRLSALSEATDAYAQAVERAARPVSVLRGEMGALAGVIDGMDEQALILAEAQARIALSSAGKGIVKDFGIAKFADPENARFDRLARSLDITEDNARALVQALRLVDTAANPEQALRSAQQLRDVMIEMAGGADEAAEKYGERFKAISDYIAGAEAMAKAAQSEVARLRDEYDKTTATLGKLSADLSQAEAERAKASAAGKAEEVAQWDRVIAKIREMVYETRAAASETDTLFERMGKAAQGFMSRAGGFVDGVTGRMAGSTAISIGKQYAGMGERPNREELKNLVGVDPATVAWCAAFMNAVLDKSGSKGTGSLSARSFLNWGEATDSPGYGDVVVLKRGKSRTAGHVGFYEGANQDGTIRVFGGNQGDRVGTSNFRASDVLGYRRAPAPGRYVDPAIAADEERIAQAGIRAAEAEKEQKRLTDETAASVKQEVAERERKAEAMRQAQAALSESLVSQQKAADLERQRAEQIAAINAGPGSDADKASAIAQVNAAMERQVTVMALMEEAKRRQVDLDAQMVGSAMTYRQAIEALGAAKEQQIVADQRVAASSAEVAQRQQGAVEASQSLNQTLLSSAMAGDSLDQVLRKLAGSLIDMALQALVAGEGPLASLFGVAGGMFNPGGGGGLFGGFRASGGPVEPGKAYVVGERGTEIIVPRAAGEVIPNHKLGGSTFAPSNTIIVQGDASEQTVMLIRRELAANNRQMERLMPSAVQRVNRDPLKA